jgi:hypothetical protein
MSGLPEARPPSLEAAKEAACKLARLMERQLGYAEGNVDPVAIRLFLLAHWSKVSRLAHTIHREGGL